MLSQTLKEGSGRNGERGKRSWNCFKCGNIKTYREIFMPIKLPFQKSKSRNILQCAKDKHKYNHCHSKSDKNGQTFEQGNVTRGLTKGPPLSNTVTFP